MAKMLRKKGYSDVDVETLNSVKVKDQAQGNDTTLYEVSFNEKDAEKKAARQLKAKERMDAIQAAKIDAFRRATVIHDVFTKYDEDNNGYIDANEMKTMIADTIAKSDPQPPSDSEVALFMGALDPDGSGHVHEEDIIRFFMGGAAQNEQRRRNFANRSPMHAKLDHFINYVLLSAHMGDH